MVIKTCRYYTIYRLCTQVVMLTLQNMVLYLYMSEQTPNYNLRRAVAVSGAIIGVAGAAGIVGQSIENGIKSDDRKETIIENFEGDQDFLANIVAEANKPADPLDIQDMITVDGSEALVDAGQSIVVNLDGYAEKSDLIDYTILQSALAQGTYQEGETYAVTTATIEGQHTYIIQPVDKDQFKPQPSNESTQENETEVDLPTLPYKTDSVKSDNEEPG